MADPTATLKDAAYVAIGFGVLAFQRAQVRRRELEKKFEAQAGELKAQAEELKAQVARLATDIEERVDPALDDVEGILPPPAQDLFRQARAVAKDVRVRLAS